MAQTTLTDDALINRFVALSADFLAQVRNGQVAEEVASVRALLDACDLAVHIPPLRAIERSIIDKLDDERERAAVRNIAETWFDE